MEARPTEPVLVVTGGIEWTGPLPRFDAATRYVIAVDSGVELALQLGLPCAVVIGDLDSATPEALQEAERLGARIDRHPVDKDATDLELALDLACAQEPTEIVIIGGAGGRTSHLLGNATLVASKKYSAFPIKWLLPYTEIQVAQPGRAVRLEGDQGDLVSLIPVAGPSSGVVSSGLRWQLDGDTLSSGSSRGISNELLAESGKVAVESGTLLVIHERPQP